MDRRGFTIIEVLIIIVVISTLAGITIMGYGTWRQRTATTAVKAEVSQATSSLESYKNFRNDYPPNFAGTGFASSSEVALKLYTNAPQTRVYENLTPAQNAQLFLNSCNASMPITSGSTTFNTSCAFAGNNVHVKGNMGSNVVLPGPTIDQADLILTCGSACDAAEATIISDFLAQGGTFPISVPNNQVTLPEPTMMTYGTANAFCLEGRSAQFSNIVYHTTHENQTITAGACPDDPDLHYP